MKNEIFKFGKESLTRETVPYNSINSGNNRVLNVIWHTAPIVRNYPYNWDVSKTPDFQSYLPSLLQFKAVISQLLNHEVPGNDEAVSGRTFWRLSRLILASVPLRLNLS